MHRGVGKGYFRQKKSCHTKEEGLLGCDSVQIDSNVTSVLKTFTNIGQSKQSCTPFQYSMMLLICTQSLFPHYVRILCLRAWFPLRLGFIDTFYHCSTMPTFATPEGGQASAVSGSSFLFKLEPQRRVRNMRVQSFSLYNAHRIINLDGVWKNCSHWPPFHREEWVSFSSSLSF